MERVRERRGQRSRLLPLGVLLLVTLLLLFAAPALLSPFRLNLLGKFLSYAIVALGLDLLWGYAGMLSLGQGVFFGLGGYAMGMYLKLAASPGKLPDFMSWSGLSHLPAYWYPFASPAFALGVAIVLPAVLAGLLGYLLTRSGVSGVYFAIITQALAFIASTLVVGQQPFTGGTNGLTDFRTLLGARLRDTAVQLHLYQATVLVLLLAFSLTYLVTQTRFGQLLVAMRDDEQRLRFLGFSATTLRAAVFAMSAALAGLAGALFVPQVGIINPDSLGIILSIQMVAWVAVGGRGTLWGPVLGTILVNAAQSAISESFPSIWQYFIGALFVATVLFFPRGLAGAGEALAALLQRLPGFRPLASATAAPAISLEGVSSRE